MGMRGGAVCHIRAISAGVRPADLVDDVAEDALQGEGFGAARAGVFVAQRVKASGGLVSIVRTDTCLGESNLDEAGQGLVGSRRASRSP